MSEQAEQSKKELSEQELEQAAGGMAMAPDSGGTVTGSASTRSWVDEEGVLHEGDFPSAGSAISVAPVAEPPNPVDAVDEIDLAQP